ncbi:tetratricopeptide repeat protein [Campylobacter sp.]|uniref:tetratricopeptide repeat protein n=1 Tax=Campylobacter sp. TaxID=205 RepID=UPI002709692F|nr:tetratricopeptide repeat protein [Campylobacter sp.]
MIKRVLFAAFLTVFASAQSNFERAVDAFLSDNEKDQEIAINFSKKSCYEDSVAAACYIAAKSMQYRFGSDYSQKEIYELYKKSCDMGDMDGCKSLGDIYNEGSGEIRQDHKTARELYLKSCAAKVGEACLEVGNFYRYEKDMEKATEFYELACENDESYGCFTLASIYESGKEGVSKDIKKAKKFFQTACSKGLYEACEDLERLSDKPARKGI